MMPKLDGRDLVGSLAVVSLVYGVSQWSAAGAWVTFGLLLAVVWAAPYLRGH